MRATWRPLASWPFPERAKATAPFRMNWSDSLSSLEAEIEAIGGNDVVIGVVIDPAQVGISGNLKAGGNTAFRHVGVEVSFSTPDSRRLVFHTDAYKEVRQNIRAVAAGLEALRAVDRYGITSTAEQYAGFAQLTAGGPDPDRGRLLVERAGSVKAALMLHHPDHGGDPKNLADVAAYRKAARGMRRLVAVALLLVAAFVAGAIAMLELVDRLFGGAGVVLELRPAHRRLLDGDGGLER